MAIEIAIAIAIEIPIASGYCDLECYCAIAAAILMKRTDGIEFIAITIEIELDGSDIEVGI